MEKEALRSWTCSQEEWECSLALDTSTPRGLEEYLKHRLKRFTGEFSGYQFRLREDVAAHDGID